RTGFLSPSHHRGRAGRLRCPAGAGPAGDRHRDRPAVDGRGRNMTSSIFRRLLVGLALTAAACGGDDNGPAQADQPEPATAGCHDGTASNSPALYQVCYPASWNGDLVVYAHGYVS